MWIFSATQGDPMLLDSCAGLRQMHETLTRFIASSAETLALPACTKGNPAPYDRFLDGLRIVKRDGEASLVLGPDNWLELAALEPELKRLTDEVLVEEETDHHHWCTRPISLIIEADTIWVNEHESWERADHES